MFLQAKAELDKPYMKDNIMPSKTETYKIAIFNPNSSSIPKFTVKGINVDSSGLITIEFTDLILAPSSWKKRRLRR